MNTYTALAVVAIALVGCKDKPADTKATPTTEAPKAETPKATFTKKAPVEKQKHEEKSSMKMDLTLDVEEGGKKKTSSIKQTENESRTEEILAVKGDAITKVKVTYADISGAMGDGKDEHKKTDARAGKTYIVEYLDGKLAITDEAGKKVVPAEATPVEKDFALLGKEDPIAAAIPSRTLKPGEDVPEVGKAIENLLKSTCGKDIDVSGATAKFREQKGDEGIFDVTVTLGKSDGPMKMSIPLKGEMRVRTADSDTSGIKLSGPIVVTTADGEKKTKMDGKGTMDIESTRTLK
jgi:hypothetical protein